jgi:ABC-type branched-subunit amino acid transport system substrate-binding protein
MRTVRTVIGLGLALTLGVAVVACDDDGGGSSSSTDTRGGGEPTGEPIKIMQIAVLSGQNQYTNVQNGAIAAVDEINQNGGVNGRPLELIQCDTEGTLTGSEDCGQQAVEEGVVAGVGCADTNDSGYLGVFAENDLACIGNVTGADPAAFTSPSSFPMDPGAFAQLPGSTRFLASEGATTIAFAYPPEGAAAATQAQQGLEDFPDTELVDIVIPSNATDLSSYAAAATEGDIDAIYALLVNDLLPGFIEEVRVIDEDIPIAFTTTDPTLAVADLGDLAEGLYANGAYLPPSSDAATGYRAAMEAAGFEPAGGLVLNSYVAVQVFADLVDGMNNITSKKVLDAANAVSPPGLEVGLRPPVQFTDPVQQGLRIFSLCIALLVVEDGDLALIDADKPFTNAITGKSCPLS